MGRTIAFTPAEHIKPGPFRANPNASTLASRKLCTFVVDRERNRGRSLRRAIGRLIADEPEIFKRTASDIRAYLENGEMVCVYELQANGRRRLVAVSIYQIFDFDILGKQHQIVEIGLTVIRKSRRSWGLSEVAASAIMVHALSQHDDLVAILNTFRESNAACGAANGRVYAEVGGFLDLRLRYPKLSVFQKKRRLAYRTGGWVGHGLMALMTEQTFRAAVSVFAAAAKPQGFRTARGDKVKLGDGWNSPGFWEEFDAMLKGRTPKVETWKRPTPSVRGAA